MKKDNLNRAKVLKVMEGIYLAHQLEIVAVSDSGRRCLKPGKTRDSRFTSR